jgi:hypothetical protein
MEELLRAAMPADEELVHLISKRHSLRNRLFGGNGGSGVFVTEDG